MRRLLPLLLLWTTAFFCDEAHAFPKALTAYTAPANATTAGNVTWSVRSTGYGPLPGQSLLRWSHTGAFGTTPNLAATLTWQDRPLDITGYYWIGARFYDPAAGRFLSPDPLGHAASWDLYSYAGGDPINSLDVSGAGTQDLGKISGFDGVAQEIAAGSMQGTLQNNLWEWNNQPLIDQANALKNIPLVGLVAEGLLGAWASYNNDDTLASASFGDAGLNALESAPLALFPEGEVAGALEEGGMGVTGLGETTDLVEAGEVSEGESASLLGDADSAGNSLTRAGEEGAAAFEPATAAESGEVVEAAMGEGAAAEGVEAMAGESAPAAEAGEAISSGGAPGGASNMLPSGGSGMGGAGATAGESAPEAAENAPQTLYHYTNEEGLKGILGSNKLNPSLKALNPSDARYGNGQYLTDIVPGTKTPAQLSRAFVGRPFFGARYTNFVQIDVTGLNVVQGRAGVFVVPSETPLDLTGRIISHGTVPSP